MIAKASTRYTRWLFLAVGLGDLGAGLALAFVPAMVLPWLGLAAPGAEAEAYLRWIGTFAAAVGATYLWGGVAGEPGRLRSALGFTMIFRVAVGLYATVAVVRGWLAPTWAAVAVANGGLVVAQSWLLAKGAGRDE